jgi:small-conductance mechanosensitive channel
VSAARYLETIVPIVAAIALATAGYFLSRWVASWLHRRGAPPQGVRTVRIALLLVGFALAGVVLFVAFGPIGLASGLTFSALLGLGVTLALQTTLQNLIAGFILVNNRLLRLRDRVTIGGVTGTIVQIGLVSTWLRLDDGSVAQVSHASMLSGPMINRSAGDRLKGEI